MAFADKLDWLVLLSQQQQNISEKRVITKILVAKERDTKTPHLVYMHNTLLYIGQKNGSCSF